MKWYSVLLIILSVVVVIAIVGGIMSAEGVEEIPVYEEAVIRVPGEFSGEIKYLYNGDFVSQSYEGESDITLKFKKEGYYHILLDGKEYIFVYNPSADEYKYSLDLIDKEYTQIRSNIFTKNFLAILILESGLIGITFVVLFIISVIKKRKGKSQMYAKQADVA